VEDLTSLDLEGRLAKRLLELAEEYGRPSDGAIEIALPVTQDDLAAMIGVARASVNRVIGAYEDRGLLERRGRRIAILDPERLRRRIL
jgi:CRP/FNR family transcriptional regulator